MKNSKVLYLLLVFVMCLSLAACGGGGEEITTPAWFEGMVSDSQNKVDINTYGGTWTGDSGSMVVELSESGDEVRFTLYDAAGEITASGFIQTAPQYSADYFYNEHDGIAHRCSAPGDTERTAVDWGKLQTAEGEGAYSAVSDNFEDVAYDMTVIDGTTFYWGGENDNYQKLS